MRRLLFILLGFSIMVIVIANYSNPSTPVFYSIKRLEEKIALNAARNPSQKMYIYEQLLKRRYQELREIAPKNELSLIYVSSSRYRTTIGEFIKIATQNSQKNYQEDVKSTLFQYKLGLKEAHDYLLNKYGVMSSLDQRKAIQEAMDASDIYSSLLQKE